MDEAQGRGMRPGGVGTGAGPIGLALFILAIGVGLLVFGQGGCRETNPTNTSATTHAEMIRVRILQDQERVDLAAVQSPAISTASNPSARKLQMPGSSAAVSVTLTNTGWKIGNADAGTGVLTIQPDAPGTVSINRLPYRGSYRFVPVSANRFDVVNDVEIDDYLKGVLAKELFGDWQPETFRAQAIVARTYALYEAKTDGIGRYWDVFGDTRSQMYGGLAGESAKSRQAVDDTAGVVLVAGDGDGKIFHAYFSSCCGGVTQAASDAFGNEPYSLPLSEQDNHGLCNESPHFTWGPITVKKDELTRRFRLWGDRRAKLDGKPRAESQMAMVYRMDVYSYNRYGRPTRFIVTDVRGTIYNWAAEEMRGAVDTDAPATTLLPSSFCKVNGSPNSDSVTFFDGHGFGHGVGMCQWCAETRARRGQTAETILAEAYPGSRLARAY
jgi:stage II sporulation protein D